LSLTKIEDRPMYFGSDNYSQEWITIEESDKVKTILDSYGDEQKRSIIYAVATKPLTFPEIVKACKMPLATCHRKIYSLMEGGLLVSEDGYSRIRSKRFRSAFKEIRINVKKDAIIVDARPR